ncbi:M14 family metallopeptidase [Brevundimonas sp.]|uniref:M14 family metallopeptidase n=1 Tax=Brevundimonas sp. TaxID=1871086 RepID=UPI003BA85451
MFRRCLSTACAALLGLAALVSVPAGAHAQELLEGATDDASVPTVAQVLGHESGAVITPSADVRRYFEALRTAAPDRVVIGEYARTHEGRPTFWAAVGSARNIARLDQIKADSRALADPRRTSRAQADAIIADMPVIVWMMYSVHGNEISPADASMAAARHLLASLDPAVQGWMANAVVVFVPTQNPDGRERFLSTFNAGFGATPNPDPMSAERDEPWPSGRYNHDLFDLNRDWFIQTQPETRGHALQIRDWRPQVLVDSHEMGTDETFFFPPEAQPLNPWIKPSTLESREMIGMNNARNFDAAGVPYFTRQVYDAFYPGYGDGWPGYLGAVSMTYEQGSSRGLIARRSSGEILTYRDTVRNHLIATLSTIESSADNRERLLRNFYDYAADGVAGRGAYVLSRAAWDPAQADRLAGLLVRSGVEVGRATASFTACGKSYPAGSYVVNLSQPQRRMAEVLLTRDVAIPADFLAEQERRRARGLSDEIYDVTAWSLPLVMNTPSDRCDRAPNVSVAAATGDLVQPAVIAEPDAAYGYLVAPGLPAGRLLSAALQAGISVRAMDKPFTHAGRRWPSGTLVIARAGNPADLTTKVVAWAATTGAEVVGARDSWVSDGPSFGSSDAFLIRAPRVALAWDSPADTTGSGAARYVIERELGYPVTVVRVDSLADGDLSRFQVIVLPEGRNYQGRLGAAGVTHLREWVENGGTLIGLGTATRLLTDPDSKMLAARRENASEVEGDAKEEEAAAGPVIRSESDYESLIENTERGPDSVAGVLARAEMDPEHWLSAGVAPVVNVLVKGSDIYGPLKRGEGRNVARFGSADDLLASGQLWAENRRQLAYKPAVMVNEQGRGVIIAFVQDPTFRGYMSGLEPLLANAIFHGPAHAQPTWAP